MIPLHVNLYGKTGKIYFPNHQDHIARCIIHTKSFYELALLNAIREMNLRGTYVDVGAHVGNHTLFFSMHCFSTKVIAIESDPQTFEYLQKTTDGIQNIITKNIAIMNKDGFVDIIRPMPNNSGMNYVQWSSDSSKGVKAQILDEAVSDQDVVLIKLDIEGQEVCALQGASNLLKKRPVLIVELRNPQEDRLVSDFLLNIGYRRGHRYCSTPTYIWHP